MPSKSRKEVPDYCDPAEGDPLPVSAFDYGLPPELIAQRPLPDRAASRLLVLHRAAGTIEHRTFSEFPSLLGAGDALVLNTSRVMPARLHGSHPKVASLATTGDFAIAALPLPLKEANAHDFAVPFGGASRKGGVP